MRSWGSIRSGFPSTISPCTACWATPVVIPVPEELETVPGIPQHPDEVDWYRREYPLESHNVENRAYRQ